MLALQLIVSRNADPLHSLVVSVTSFRTATDAYNVIPETVELRGTVRSFDTELRQPHAETRVKAIASHTAAVFGGRAEVVWEDSYPAMVNHETETGFALEAARRVSASVDHNAAAVMGGEDFAYMLEACPGAYIQVGAGEGRPASITRPMTSTTRRSRPALPIGRSSPNSGSRRMGRRPVDGRHSARGLAEAATPARVAG